jgi:hypothetical protein
VTTPNLPGFTVTWDADAESWMAVSEVSGKILRGKTERQLELARNAVVAELADDLQQIFRDAPVFGYSPPPRTSP